jgi:hypothetical protein
VLKAEVEEVTNGTLAFARAAWNCSVLLATLVKLWLASTTTIKDEF